MDRMTAWGRKGATGIQAGTNRTAGAADGRLTVWRITKYPVCNTAGYMADQSESVQISLRVPLRKKAELERDAAAAGKSRSEYIRDTLAERHAAAELRERLEAREDRIEDLEAELRRRSQIEEKIDTLAKQEQEPAAPWPVRWVRWFRSGGED
jgi:hypothetical protein